MTVRRVHKEDSILYFVTFTCIDWIPLIDETNAYSFIIKQLKICVEQGYQIAGYVIMPNHVHLLIYVPQNGNLNVRIGNMKRFISYEIVKRLSNGRLIELARHVNITDRLKNQRHDVFIKSFDAKPVYSRKFAEQKLGYVHENPVKGKWQLIEDYTSYEWSSIKSYNEQDFSLITHYADLV